MFLHVRNMGGLTPPGDTMVNITLYRLTNCAPFHEGHPRGDEAELRQYFGRRQVDWDLLYSMNLSHDCMFLPPASSFVSVSHGLS